MKYRDTVVRAVNGGSSGKTARATGLSNEGNRFIHVFRLRTVFKHGVKTLTKQILTFFYSI